MILVDWRYVFESALTVDVEFRFICMCDTDQPRIAMLGIEQPKSEASIGSAYRNTKVLYKNAT